MKKSEKKRLEKQLKLQKQAEADRYLARVRGDENKALKKRLQATIDRETGMHKALNAALIELAVKFGEKTEGGWVLVTPAPSAQSLQEYEIRTEVSEDRKTFTTTVRRIESAINHQGDAAGAE